MVTHLRIMRKRTQYWVDIFPETRTIFVHIWDIYLSEGCLGEFELFRWRSEDHVRWSCCGCWHVRRPSGNEADKHQQWGANNRSGPRTRNLKPAEAHWAVCLQEILEPLSVLSERDNRCQQTCVGICAIPPTLQDMLKIYHILKLQTGTLNV